MTDKKALEVLESWLRVAYQNADGTDECSAELYEALQTMFSLITHQQAEIEKLQKHNSVAAHKHYNDGIKEFAERLKETAVEAQLGDYYYKITTVQGIDYILKEMVSDNK